MLASCLVGLLASTCVSQSMLFSGWNTISVSCWLHAWWDYWPLHVFHSLCCSVGGTLNVGFMLGGIIGLYMRFTVYAVQWVEH